MSCRCCTERQCADKIISHGCLRSKAFDGYWHRRNNAAQRNIETFPPGDSSYLQKGWFFGCFAVNWVPPVCRLK
jgi:hypothetical protein